METKHTQGSWRVADWSGKPNAIITSNNGLIAEISNHLGEAQANALLISKAPEMLELLIDIKKKVKLELLPESIETRIRELIKQSTL